MKFSIVIPNITKKEDKLKLLETCLSSFFEFHKDSPLVHEVIIVDDGSPENFQNKVKLLAESYKVRLIAKEKNEGFSTTVNAGIKEATGDIVVLVNNDIKFTRPILEEFKKSYLNDKKTGIVGCLLFYPNGTVQHGGIYRHGMGFAHYGWHKPYEHAQEVHYKKYLIGVTGAMFAMRKTMIDEIGMFDETFFMSCEDTQYCLRAWLGGWKVLYSPDASAIHIEGGTRGASTTEKLSSSIDTRNWYIQELKTSEKFQAWLKTINISDIDRMVNDANLMPSDPMTDIHITDVVDERPAEVKKDSCPVVVNTSKIIGIRRTGALGDVLMATPIIRELKNRHPMKKIWFATHSPEALRGNIYVDNIVRDISEIRPHTDVIYDLDLAYENNPKMHVTDAYAKVVFNQSIGDKSLMLHSDSNNFSEIIPLLSGINFERDRVVVMHMAVSWANRTWPKESWGQLIRLLTTRGYKVLTVGRGSDFRSELMSGVINLVDRLSIPQVRELIKKANVFIGPDSGLMHIAQTTNTPVVGIFTVANPAYRISRTVNFFPLVPKSDCKFCLHEEKPPVTFVGCKIKTMQCLREITAGHVVSAIDQLGG